MPDIYGRNKVSLVDYNNNFKIYAQNMIYDFNDSHSPILNQMLRELNIRSVSKQILIYILSQTELR